MRILVLAVFVSLMLPMVTSAPAHAAENLAPSLQWLEVSNANENSALNRTIDITAPTPVKHMAPRPDDSPAPIEPIPSPEAWSSGLLLLGAIGALRLVRRLRRA